MHANGEYIHFLNSGDWLFSPDSYQSIFANYSDCDIIYSDVALSLSEHQTYIKKLPEEITLSFFFDDIINHQNAIFNSALFNIRRYDESYKLAADYKSYIEYCLEGRRFAKSKFIISYFDAYGVGSTNDELNKAEREKIIDELLPSAIKQDCITLVNHRKNYKFIENRKSFHHIMSFAYSLCKFIDPLLQKLDKKKLIKR